MKSFSELRTAVENAGNPQSAAGTFVDGLWTLLKTNKGNPSTIDEVANGLNANRSSIIHSLAPAPSVKQGT